jgi:thioesterase-3
METLNGPVHSYPLIILESHLDTFGHVNNATYLQLFEEARWEMITANGYGLKRVQETGLGPIILEVQIRFGRELRLRQKVTIKTRISSYSRKLAVISQEIVNEENQLCCKAEFKFGIFDLKERKLTIPTNEWLHALGIPV